MSLLTRRVHTAAASLYEHLGFERVGGTHGQYDPAHYQKYVLTFFTGAGPGQIPAQYQGCRRILRELGVAADYSSVRNLPLQPEASQRELVEAGSSEEGRPIMLARSTAEAWNHMRDAAATESHTLILQYGFRSVVDQLQAIQMEKAKGKPMVEIMSRWAAPGFSEHHTGFAIDIATPGCYPVTPEFEQTAHTPG